MTQGMDKHWHDSGIACYLGGRPLELVLLDARGLGITDEHILESLRRGWLDEQARTWSTEWPTARGHYWAWLQSKHVGTWDLSVVLATRMGSGVAHSRFGALIWPKEFTGAMFCPIALPLPAPLPEGALVSP